jgi:hypothetical protein
VRDINPGIVIAAALIFREPHAALDVLIACACAA